MTTSPAQLIALTRARALLTAAGVKWAILNEDGTTDGPLQVRVLKANALPEPKYRTSRGPRATLENMQAKYNWRPQVLAMRPSDSAVFEVQNPDDAKRLGANIKSCVHRHWGPENFVISVIGQRVEVLRIM